MNMDQYFNPKVLKILIGVVGALIVISILIMRFGNPSFSESQIELKIEGPEQIESGQEVEWNLKIVNNTKTDLNSVSVVFTYPSDSVVLNSEGKAEDKRDQTISIGSLKQGETSETKFKAFIVGDRGDVKIANARMSFKAGSLRSSFEKSTELATTITAVPVSLTLAAAPNILPNQNVIYTLDYRNTSSQAISDVRFTAQYPDGFSVVKTTPLATDSNVWLDASLNGGEAGRITIEGSMAAREGETKEVSVVLERKLGDNYIAYAKARASSIVASPLLTTFISANDSADYISHTGDTLRYTLKYKNSSNFNLSGLKVSALLEGDMLDLGSVGVPLGFFDAGTKSVIWDAGSVSQLSLLRPGQSGELKFSVRVKPNFPSGNPGNHFVKATAKIFSSNIPTGYDGSQISATSQVVTKIGTKASFSQFGFFNDPAYGSLGPVPPKVGSETTITIHWQISNPGNDIKNGLIRATLPSGVSWKNNVSVGSGQPEPTFNPNTSEVSWNIGNIPQGVGVGAVPYEASFQISITPNSTQVGSGVTLLRSSSFSGVDSFTNQSVTVEGPDLTTPLLVDAGGNGEVVQ